MQLRAINSAQLLLLIVPRLQFLEVDQCRHKLAVLNDLSLGLAPEGHAAVQLINRKLV